MLRSQADLRELNDYHRRDSTVWIVEFSDHALLRFAIIGAGRLDGHRDGGSPLQSLTICNSHMELQHATQAWVLP